MKVIQLPKPLRQAGELVLFCIQHLQVVQVWKGGREFGELIAADRQPLYPRGQGGQAVKTVSVEV